MIRSFLFFLILISATSLKAKEDKRSANNDVNSLIKKAITYRNNEDYKIALQFANHALQQSNHNQQTENAARSCNTIGTIYLRLKDYNKALVYFLWSLRLKEKLANKSLAAEYGNIATVFKSIGAHQRAINYNLKAINEYKKFDDKKGVAITLNNLSNVYSNTNQLAKGIDCLAQAKQIYALLNDTINIAVVNYNLGGLFIDFKDFDLALSYTQEALATFSKLNKPEYLILSKIQLTNILLILKENSKAVNLFNTINEKEIDDYTISDYYLVKSKLLETNLKYNEALHYFKLSNAISDSLLLIEHDEKIASLLSNFELEKEKQNILIRDQELKEQKLKNKLNYIILFSLVIIFVITLYLLIREIKIRKMQIITIKKDEELIRLKLIEKENELFLADQKLKSFTNQLIEKAEQINELQNQSRTIVKELEKNVNEDQLNELILTKILTAEDWNNFKKLFNSVYPNFISKITSKLPDLSQGELRLFLLIKLNLKTSDLSSLLGISPESVKKAKYRLKKKLELTEEMSLESFIKSIDKQLFS